MLFFLKPNNDLIGLITDGDIRRILVNNNNLDVITNKIINKNFYYENNCDKYISECNKKFTYIPVLTNRKLIGIISNVCG